MEDDARMHKIHFQMNIVKYNTILRYNIKLMKLRIFIADYNFINIFCTIYF